MTCLQILHLETSRQNYRGILLSKRLHGRAIIQTMWMHKDRHSITCTWPRSREVSSPCLRPSMGQCLASRLSPVTWGIRRPLRRLQRHNNMLPAILSRCQVALCKHQEGQVNNTRAMCKHCPQCDRGSPGRPRNFEGKSVKRADAGTHQSHE